MRSLRVSQKITNKSTQSFKQYLNDIASIPLFTLDEENECCLKVANGDKRAKEELIKKNLRFVVTIAKKFETTNLPLEDLVNEGNIGLILAADRYDAKTGFKFISYAVYWVRKVIYEYISNTSKMIRIPCNKVSSISKFNLKMDKLEQQRGRHVDAIEVLEELEGMVPPQEIKNFEKFLNLKVDSLDGVFSHGDNETSLYDVIMDESMRSPDFSLTQKDVQKELDTLLNVLKPRDKKIMINIYGLNGSVPMTLDQVSQEVGLTREMIRQIKISSLEKLKIGVRKILY